MLVRKIDEIRIDKRVEGISEVRDESDRKGLQITIDLKKDADEDLIVNYLLLFNLWIARFSRLGIIKINFASALTA